MSDCVPKIMRMSSIESNDGGRFDLVAVIRTTTLKSEFLEALINHDVPHTRGPQSAFRERKIDIPYLAGNPFSFWMCTFLESGLLIIAV